jgi:acyl dehydratase/NAD(P)-dependent dehydrogenase (short-subunit alcohol dehydrogenase family)
MIAASFETSITEADARRFAELSGDWNPLHTDPEYAATTAYRRPILHGAFSAGLFSRMAGMHIPGKDCLLHGMRLRFVAAILPPAKLKVTGRLVRESGDAGQVEVTIDDVETGQRYVDGGYEFGRHQTQSAPSNPPLTTGHSSSTSIHPILVTGASGGLGSAVLRLLGQRGLAISRTGAGGFATADFDDLAATLGDMKIGGIVHCGWPFPDNQRLTSLAGTTSAAIKHQVAEPLEQMLKLAQLLHTNGVKSAPLLLVGSTFSIPGRHAYRMPLYSLAKSLIPLLVNILALELGANMQRCFGVVFDVIDGSGMNGRMSEAVRLTHADRAPSGTLISPDEAAIQIEWLMSNSSMFVSGATIALSGGALP